MAGKKQGWGIVVGFVAAAMVLGVCVACDDDDDENGWVPASHQSGGDRDNTGSKDKGRDSRGDCEGSTNCDERDFSPTFDDSPIIVCVQPGACDFGPGEQALGAPDPNPACLVNIPWHCDPDPRRG